MNTQNLGETIESPLEPAPRSQELDKNKSPAEGECRKNVEKTVQSQEGTYCKTESCEVRTESNKTENNRPNLDLFQDTGEAETPEVCKLDIKEAAGCAKVQEEAIMEDNKCVTKLERHCDDVEMETSGSVSNTISVNIFPVPDVDGGNRKDEEVQDISTGKSTKPGISESHQTSGLPEEDQNLTKLLPTCSSSVQMGAEDLTGNDEDKQKMLEQIMTEIITHVSENDVHIQPLIGDFSEYTETQVDHGRFGHIIEIYGFSPTLTTDDLMEPFLEYREKDFRLLWVDQKHALGIFSSPEDAFAASCKTHPAMKFRPLSQASRQSKIRAHDKMASLQPYKDRPQTDASVAKRMVNRALGHRKPEADSSVKEPGTSPC
uniref:Uncharacterized protein n=2 Tax=Pyxicephalus adspersus TaxID=30357 RepID=A0AAV3AXM2_PYXAD|nr:TPA: hypothetical protein GDO54_007871 [Pyxicephalus adspersus]